MGQIKDEGLGIDCQAHLHPYAPSKIGPGSCSVAKGNNAVQGLINVRADGHDQDRRSNRRSFEEDENALLRRNLLRPAYEVEIFNPHGIVTNMQFGWGVQFGCDKYTRVKLGGVLVGSNAGEQGA